MIIQLTKKTLNSEIGREKIKLALLASTAAYGIMTGSAMAGSCTVVSAGVYSCTGAATGSDVSQILTDPGSLSVTTQPGFGINATSGAGFDLSVGGGATQDLIFDDQNASSIIGNGRGISAENNGNGALSITTTGQVTGTTANGINASNNGTNLTIDVVDVSGGSTGIFANNGGTGALSITATGNVVGSDRDGINANNGNLSTDIAINVADVSGNEHGIYAWNEGTGSVSIVSTGQVSGANDHGIFGYNSATGTNLTIDVVDVSGDDSGIYASNFGTGSTTITTSGTVTGTSGNGIQVTNNGEAQDLTVSQTGGSISGSDNGIFATQWGTGSIIIGVAGDVSGADQHGIWAINQGSGKNIEITQAAGSTITGYTHGIRADNYGTGAVTITTAGIINQTQTGDENYDTYGVYAYNYPTATDITLIQTGGSITANWFGMYANNDGTGSTKIVSSGDVTATAYAGLWADNDVNTKDLVVEQISGTIKGGTAGVYANNEGTGSTKVTLAGDVIATGNHGVYATNWGDATDLTVTQTAGSITGGGNGIYASNVGIGATTVTTAGNVTGTDGYGIAAYGWSRSTNVTVQQTSGAIVGQTGILLSNEGSGTSLVSIVDKVSGGTEGAGIQTLAANGATINIAQTATLSAASGIAIRDGGVAGNPQASDTVGGNVIVNSAGTVTGDAILGLGDDTFNLIAGTYTGNIYGDDRDDAQSSDGIVNHEGNDTFTWTGGKLIGGFYGQDGSDTATVSASGYDGSQVLDGGDDTSIADGMIDRLTLKGVTATSNGNNIINWEVVNLDGANLSIDDGAWHVGEADEGTTGVNLTNGSTLDGMASLAFDGNLTIDPTSTFVGTGNGAGVYSFTGDVTNAGTITTVDNAVGDTVIVGGNYVGNGGQILFDVALGDDHSKTDMMIVNGDTSGTTNVGVNNVGGTGAQTNEGIKIIDVNGASNGSFSLLGDYMVGGKQAVVAGAYAYQLYQGGTSTPNDGNWYLRSQLTPSDPSTPLYQAGVPTYEAYPQALLGLNGVPTLQQRVGNRFWAGNGNKVVAQGADPIGTPYAAPEEAGVVIEGNGVWGRIEGAHNSINPRFSTSSTDYDQNVFKLQAGIDGLLTETENGKLIGGITIHYAHGKTDVNSVYGDGEISTNGYGFGGTLTWYGENGFYLDGQGQVTWYKSDLDSNLANANLADGNKGFGYTLSLEGGKRIAIDPAWSLTPQAQLVYSNVDFDAFTDPFGARVSLDRGESLQGRLGLTLDHEDSWQNDNGMLNRTHVYGIANLYYEFLEGTRVDVAGTSFASEKDRLWGGLGVGGSYNWNDDKYSIYGEGLVNTSLNNFGDSYSLKGTVGFRMKW
ncbi:autotransporter outer membrane beta-barrel domain-containing protein [Brucella sp. NBRC 12950]|uniref:autotransporter outer membrane beta-barrel domain-containing protein n=1 Tax=Brucella sp. NBRC 12950 TaxID=2994518 RepID=UPI0024A0ECDC|nr:autotransporter outer membrane beta-barrel domain-containing protein [Brucella sp. NBRC 12950]GLU28066.1 autotransporter [Brucella sp. NBRC 12950]